MIYFILPHERMTTDLKQVLMTNNSRKTYTIIPNLDANLPGSIPSVLGASDNGVKMVTFLIMTFLQS